MPTLFNQPLTPHVLGLEMTESLDVLGAQLAKFVAPGINGSFGDTVLPCDVVDRRPPCFAQDSYDLTFRKIHFLHGYPFGPLRLENACTMLREAAYLRFVSDESVGATWECERSAIEECNHV